MTTIQLLACAGMITGFFIVLRISPMAFTGSVFLRFTDKPKSIKDQVGEFTKRKNPSYLRREITDVQAILRVTGRERQFPSLCAAALLLFCVGACIAIVIGNLFLVPVMAAGFLFLPFWWVKLTASHFKKDIAGELETALSIITTAYLRNEDILTAAEENMDYLNQPVLNVFRGFISRIKLVNPDVEAALSDMKDQIDNVVFKEWCDALTACQYDRSLKTTLTPIVTKLSDMRVVNGELENLVFEPRKEFVIMQVLLVGNIPLMYFLNQDWYNILMHSPLGQVIITVCAAAIFISTAIVIKLTQPIEYRR